MHSASKQLSPLLASIVLVTLLASTLSVVPAQPVQAQAADPPQTLLANTTVSDWAVANPRLLWLSYPECPPPPGPSSAAPQAIGGPLTLNRVRTTGGEARTLYTHDEPSTPNNCNPFKLNSNIVADANYVYWVEGSRLVRLSVNANPGDAPEPWGPTFQNGKNVELAIRGDHIVALQVRDCAFCIFGTRFELIATADGSSVGTSQLAVTGNSPSFDGKYIYFKEGAALRRFLPGNSAEPITIVDNAGDYVAEGETQLCVSGPIQITCTTTSYVFYVQTTGVNSIVRYNNLDGGYRTVYTPTPLAGQQARFYGLALARSIGLLGFGQSLFFFEQRFVPCNCFSTGATELLRRTGRDGGTPDDLYIRTTTTDRPSLGLRAAGDSLFWRETTGAAPDLPSTVKRLPANADALPKVNLVATGLEINQGVQRSDNSVPLIQDRRTFVRFFARSVGQNVTGVGASLTVAASGLPTISLGASNPGIGGLLTLVPSPNKNDLNQSFLFELPWEYLRAPDLRLRAVVNPFGVPLEPTAADNAVTAGPFAFQPSPRLIVNMVSFSYNFKGTNYSVNELSDIARASSLVRRLFPLASTPGYYSSEPGEIGLRGFRPLLRTIADDEIANRIDYSLAAKDAQEACKYLLVFEKDGKTVKTDDRNRCATEYVLGRMQALRNEKKLPDNPTYGFVPSPANIIPRGWAAGDRLAAGDAGGASTAAHELGHMLGRNHPFKGSFDDTNVCGNTKADGGYDNSYPYKDSLIGPGDGSVTGLDSGATSFLNTNIPITLFADTSGHDIMGYCGANQWISDYTYRCMFDFMNTGTVAKACGGAALANAQSAEPLQAGGAGDWLSIAGAIGAGGSAEILYLRRVGDVADTPARQPGGYSIQLLDGAGATLADYPFTPEAGEDGASQSFALVVPFVAGTREARLVTTTPAAVLASKPLSANPPTISGVALQNPPSPVAGTVTLGWTAADADGDALRFDVLYSRDGGTTFVPIQLGTAATSLAIDTTTLGGGSTILQVIASDGAQSAQANSEAVTIAPVPPRPRITNPGEGTRVEWRQLVNFSGEAADAQDGSLSGSRLVWSDRRGVLGTGATLATRDLLVGTNAITLTATNSAGLSASTTVTIVVGDDLLDPGPTFSVAPTAVGFSVAPGTTAVQTATLQISNVGGGTLPWAASSDAPWLTISAPSGDAPATLILSADPSSFAAGQVASATLTLTSTVPSVPPLRVPVTLRVGNTFSAPLPPGSVVGVTLHLPLLAR